MSLSMAWAAASEAGIGRQPPSAMWRGAESTQIALDSAFVTNCLGRRAFIEPVKTAIN